MSRRMNWAMFLQWQGCFYEIESHETVELPDGEKSEVFFFSGLCLLCILELNVTPNRGYCLSHIGVAREVSALLNKSLKLPDPLKALVDF